MTENAPTSGPPLPAFGPASSPPGQIGPYRVVRLLGKGAQGFVYLAEDPPLRRLVALKVLVPGLITDPVAVMRFQREAEITSKIDHPGICPVYATGEDAGSFWIAMRYVEGESLARRILAAREARSSGTTGGASSNWQRTDFARASDEHREPTASGPTTWTEMGQVLSLFEETARILHIAHEAGVVHRDIKPGNLIVTKEGSPVVLDFGLAQEIGGDYPTMTLTGDLLGTPYYMSPEQLTAQRIRLDRRTDVYSLGVSLFESLTLTRPFDASTREGIYQAILHTSTPDPRRLNSSVTKDLRVVLETAMEKDRDRRYQTALDFAEDLRRVRSREPILAKPAGPLLRLGRWTQRNPALAASLAMLFLALATGLVVALALLGREQRALRRSEAIRLTSQSTMNLASDPALALLLALEADARAPSLGTRNALLASLRELKEQRTWFGVVHASASRGGESVALTSADGRVTLLDVEQGFAETPITGPPGPASLTATSPAGDRVVVAGRDGGAILWSAGGSKALRPVRTVQSALFSANGERIALCDQDTLRIWDAATLAVVAEHPAPDSPEICSDSQGRVLVTSPFDAAARLVRADGSEPLPLGPGIPKRSRLRAALDVGGDRVVTWDMVTGSSDLSATASWNPIAAYRPAAPVKVAAFSAGDPPLLATGLANGTTALWSRDGAPAGELVGHTGPVTAVAFSPDGRHLATGSEDHDVRVWDASTHVCLAVLRGHRGAVTRVIPGAGCRSLVSLAEDGALRVWSPVASGTDATPTAAEAHRLLPWISPLGRESVAGGGEDAPRVGPADPSDELRLAAEGYLSELKSGSWWTIVMRRRAVYSPDGRWVAALRDDGRVVLRGTAPADPPRVLDDLKRTIWFLAFSPDSKVLAVQCAQGGRTRRCLVGVNAGGKPVWLADPPSRHLICISRDGALAVTLPLAGGGATVLRTSDGEVVASLRGPSENLLTAAFSPDGRRVAGGSQTGAVHVWDLVRPDAPAISFRHQGGIVRSLCASDDGKLFLSSAEDGTVRVWSLESGEEALTIHPARKPLNAIFSDDGKRVITLEEQGVIREWPLDVAGEARRRRSRDLTPDEVDRFETLPAGERRAYRERWDSRMHR